MTIETMRYVAGTTVPTCEAQFCNRVTYRHGLCLAHHRCLKLTTTVQDAVHEFLGGLSRDAIRPGASGDKKIVEAGELLALGMGLLVGTVFGPGVVFDGRPMSAQMGGKDFQIPRWRVQFSWTLVDDLDADLEDSYDDDLNDDVEDLEVGA